MLELVLWLGFWVRVWVRFRVDFRVRVGVRIMVNLSNPYLTVTITLTKTLKLNPNLLSYWECCRNMVMKKKFAPDTVHEGCWHPFPRKDAHGRSI